MGRKSAKANRVLLCLYPENAPPIEEEHALVSSPDHEPIPDDMQLDSEVDWTDVLDQNPIVLHDRMMTDAAQSPRIQSEHSYSLTLNDELPASPFGIKLEDYAIKLEDKDMEAECFPTVSMADATNQISESIKQEPVSPPPASTISSLLKQPTIVLASRPPLILPKVTVKAEATGPGFSLPPTPPSCNGSDSEGSLSPRHGVSSTASHQTHRSSTRSSAHSTGRRSHAKVLLPITAASKSYSNSSSLISCQPKGATGILELTDEEKRTLLAEGYHIPQKLPLTKAEERSLKKIRRKIKNKISAQESRRKKKEYMDALEKRVELLSKENTEYRKKIDVLEDSNKSLTLQLQHRHTLAKVKEELKACKKSRNAYTQTSSAALKQIGMSSFEFIPDEDSES